MPNSPELNLNFRVEDLFLEACWRRRAPRNMTFSLRSRRHQVQIRLGGANLAVLRGTSPRRPLMLKINPLGEEGVEPSWAEAQQILSLSCMPFHHSPRGETRGANRSRTGLRGFADLCLTARPSRQRPRKIFVTV